MKTLQTILLFTVICTAVSAQDVEETFAEETPAQDVEAVQTVQAAEKDWNIVPLLNYEYFSFDKQHVHSPGEGFMFTLGNQNPPLTEARNSFSLMGMAKQYIIEESESGYSDLYHAINVMADKRINHHSILGVLVCETDKPLYGGLRSFIAGIGYGYECVRKENMSLILGIDVAVMDTDIELPNGETLPVLVLPQIRFNVKTSWIDFSFMFLNKPVFTFTFFPDSRIRLVNTAVVFMSLRDARDVIIDTMLMYRFFSKDSKIGDLAGIGVGFKNNRFGFTLAEKEKYYDLVYHSVYGMIDLSFLQISSGYLFNSIESYDLDKRKNIGNGFFVNVMLAWQF